MHRLASVVAGAALITCAWSASAQVQSDAIVPGGTTALSQLLQVPSVPDQGRFLPTVIQIAYGGPRQGTGSPEAVRRRLVAYFADKTKTAPPADRDRNVVPLPLTPDVWNKAIFRRTVNPDALVSVILTDRRAALICYGLTAMDDETLRFFAEHPITLTRLYEGGAATFAAFGDAIQVRDGKLVIPGGDDATPQWEALVGQKVIRIDRFLETLFRAQNGRAAYVYDTMRHLDPAHAAFAAGTWMPQADARIARFKQLVAGATNAFGEWDLSVAPFARPAAGLPMILSRVRVDEHGAPAGSASSSLWHAVFNTGVKVDSPADGDRPIDAAWLIENVLTASVNDRERRVEQFGFGQRAFADPAANRSEVVTAIRGEAQYPLLMLTLERLGIASPSLYSAAVRQAERVTALGPSQGYVALAQLQGAMALVTRLMRVRTIDRAAAESLLAELVAVPLGDGGHYDGSIALWFENRLRLTLPGGRSEASQGDEDLGVEPALLSAAAGRPADPTTMPVVVWESQRYRLDVAGSELRRLQRIRQKQGGAPLDLVLQLARLARSLARNAPTPESLQQAVQALKPLLDEITASENLDDDVAPPGVDLLSPIREVKEAFDHLSAQEAAPDAPATARIGARLVTLADQMLAQKLVSLAYAFELMDSESTMFIATDVSRRHDFGYGLPYRDPKLRTAWTVAKPMTRGAPWHLAGSVLALDAALASVNLRRIDVDRVPAAPSLNIPEYEAYAASVALLDPLRLVDDDMHAAAEAIARGRKRFDDAVTAGGEAVDRLAADAGVDGRRRRALGWALGRGATAASPVLSMTELLVLGGGVPARFDAWGVSAFATDGCLCSRVPLPATWELWTGQSQFGLPRSLVADLHWRIALALHDKRLPAPLAKAILAAAAQDWIDKGVPIGSDDWLTLARDAQALTDRRVDDYVAAAAADGPLVLEGR